MGIPAVTTGGGIMDVGGGGGGGGRVVTSPAAGYTGVGTISGGEVGTGTPSERGDIIT